jgi:GntP family gluconate:H+ symporter
MTSTTQILLALLVAIVFMVYLLVKTRLTPFIAMIIAALLVGFLGGMDPLKTIDAVKSGFGNTMASLGILILFGIMIGKVLEVSGGTESLGRAFVKICGRGHEIFAMIITGFVTSLAIFCVPAFVMLFPLAKDISKRTKMPISSLAVALAGGLLWSHTLVPPAVGPIGGAGIFKANLAQMMLLGFLIGIPMMIALYFYAKWLGKKYPAVAKEDDAPKDKQNLPKAGLAILPILLPVVLILLANICLQFKVQSTFIAVIGSPVIAMGLGLLVGVYTLLRKADKSKVRDDLANGVKGGANILVLIGAGGALGNVVNVSGVGKLIAEGVAKAGIPAILLPFVIATLLRLIQGSGSVAILTTASITQPMLATLGLDPVLACLAACVGSMFFSYFNDAYFWTINGSIEAKDTKQQILTWSIPTTIFWAIGGVILFILSFFI